MTDAATAESEKGGEQSRSSAFVLFRRQSNESMAELSYNEEAMRILTFSLSTSKASSDPLSGISAFCSRWAKTLESGLIEHESGKSLNPETGFIDIIPSGRRRYGVRGVILAGQPETRKQYLFILERTSLESAHHEILFRHYRINTREREIIRLLLAGNSNKEIAGSLGLTLNTVKGYMKLLTRKLGVSGRSGIVAVFVEKK
jgi:DNA-binding CsgD family transcriptional regulator